MARSPLSEANEAHILKYQAAHPAVRGFSMRFDGDFVVSVSVEQVWQALLDVETISRCLPGTAGVRQTGPDRYAGALNVKLGPISANFDLTGVVNPIADERTYRVDVNGRERLTGTLVQSTFAVRLRPNDAATHCTYELDITLRGKLGQLGQAVFQDVARKMTEQTISCLQTRLTAAAQTGGLGNARATD